MSESVKILPAVIFSAFLLLSIKIVGIWFGAQDFLAGAAMASSVSEEKEESQHSETPAEEETVSDEHADSEEPQEPASFDDRREREDSLFFASPDFMNESEVKVLQSLAARRESLNKRESNLDLQEKLLMAAESRVNEKIDNLKAIEARIVELLGTRDEEQEEQIASLVKIYETMKAKDAARIFERLETDTLLDVAARMKEQKVAAILAKMNPDSAQDLTVRLVGRREMPEFESLMEGKKIAGTKG